MRKQPARREAVLDRINEIGPKQVHTGVDARRGPVYSGGNSPVSCAAGAL